MNLISKRLNHLHRKQKVLLVMTSDFLLALISWLVFGPPMATFIASEFSTGLLQVLYAEWISFFIPAALTLCFLYYFGFYKSLIKFFDSKDSIFLCFSGSLLFGLSWSLLHINQFKMVSTAFLSIAFLQGLLLAAVLYAFLNLSRDIAKYFLYPNERDGDAKPIVIYGAGATGNELYQTLLADRGFQILAFFDDSKHLKNLHINNIPILGSFSQLSVLKKKFINLEVWLAIPSLDIELRRQIIASLEKIKVSVRSVPSLHELISDQKKMSDMQHLSMDDLLPRARVERSFLADSAAKTFLITGAGGSIGSEITRQLLDSEPKRIILLEMSEFSLFNIDRECQAIKLSKNLTSEIISLLGDIRDLKYLQNLCSKFSIDCIYHAAAYKHVPLVEDPLNTSKAAENNILGTYHLALAAQEFKIPNFIMISTDKAVRPTNVMGATKRFAENIIQSLDGLNYKTVFSMVRFGNVINSSGSVIPLFLDQIAKGGPVTVTDKNVKRYFMTIPEASNLVLQAAEMSQGGEVFILDMGDQVLIYDLAVKLIHLSGRNVSTDGTGGIEIQEVGLRPGEKMYEELLISGTETPTKNKKIFKSNETFIPWTDMQGHLKAIEKAIQENNDYEIRNILSQTVEGFSL
jgi:FlaA1/EpsC-like NDP-sugar epimerase